MNIFSACSSRFKVIMLRKTLGIHKNNRWFLACNAPYFSTMTRTVLQKYAESQYKVMCSSIVLNYVDNILPISCLSFHSSPSYEEPKISKKHITGKNRPFLSAFHNKREQARLRLQAFFQKNSAEAWVNSTPDHIRPYLQLVRADKPTGTLLLYFPCVFSICLATAPGELPSLYYLGLFGVGSFLMRGAGCIINDLWDRNLDKLVERTKQRPIASGKVSVNNAVKLLAAKLTLSLSILLSLNSTCIAIGLASMIPVVLYPLAKRVTSFPQVVLGLTFNIGAVMGYAAVAGHIDWPAIGVLYASCIVWTIYYDTIYAFQDAVDDQEAGIKSMALLFDKYSPGELSELPLSVRLLEEKWKKNKIILFLWSTFSIHWTLYAMAGLISQLGGPLYIALACSFARTIEEVDCEIL